MAAAGQKVAGLCCPASCRPRCLKLPGRRLGSRAWQDANNTLALPGQSKVLGEPMLRPAANQQSWVWASPICSSVCSCAQHAQVWTEPRLTAMLQSHRGHQEPGQAEATTALQCKDYSRQGCQPRLQQPCTSPCSLCSMPSGSYLATVLLACNCVCCCQPDSRAVSIPQLCWHSGLSQSDRR